MPSAIWTILYDLPAETRKDYLAWFHDVHIPEKLARPGYTWAAHYQVVGEGDEMSCIAMFGGETTAVFHNPSPAQLAPKQPPETKAMMGYRANSRALILAGEWAVDGAGDMLPEDPAVSAPVISLALCDASGEDMDFNAWLAQQHLPALAGADGFLGLRKLLATTGGARHALIHQYGAETAPFAVAGDDEWSDRVAGYLQSPMGAPVTARRIWPE